MSDYTSPVVSDESIDNLCSEIIKLAGTTSNDIREIKDYVNRTITKEYTVNHEPKIELPFNKEYLYVCQKINEDLASSNKTVNDYLHFFISGYLLNGSSIHFNSKYIKMYINGEAYTEDYTCRAEEGSEEKLNIFIIGNKEISELNYADIPLKNFKMIVFDDLEEPVSPNINSFLAEDIDTLKYIGNLRWIYTGLCTLRRLEVTKDIIIVNTMDCPCIKELIIPNVTNVPDTSSGSKGNIVLCDISNVKGIIGNLSKATMGDLKLKCSSIANGAFNGARLGEVNIGNSCQKIGSYSFNASNIKKLIGGLSLTAIDNLAFENCSSLTEVIFNNLVSFPIAISAVFKDCSNLKTVHFSYISDMYSSTFTGCISLTNLTFIDKSISCNLFFNASPVITEESCLNIINALANNAKVTVQLHSIVKNHMANDWYCKEENGKYVSCTAEDEGAIKQTAALIARGGTLA